MNNHENSLIDNLRAIEAELREFKRPASTNEAAGLSPELAEIAARGKSAIDGAAANEKAAPD